RYCHLAFSGHFSRGSPLLAPPDRGVEPLRRPESGYSDLDPMASKTDRVVARHRLEHLGPLRVDPEIFTARFSRACSMANCDAGCCQGGVWVDVLHRDVILEHAAVIARHMDPEQEHNPARWFEGEIADDSDFPSGKAVGTEVTDSGCVFLNAHRRCVLHAVDDVE